MKNKNIEQWQYCGNVNRLDYGGVDSRCIGGRRYQFISLTNMEDACGDDATFKYNVELTMVDLNAISSKELAKAFESYGCPDNGLNTTPTDAILADYFNSYGLYAPLATFNGNNANRQLRAAHRMANSMAKDASALESALDRRVNMIGSSAREFMRGDIMSAVQRGCESGDPSARLMAKLHGVPEQIIDDIRPDDWLPYFFGYMAGLNGDNKESDPDTCADFRGYDRGLAVKSGAAPAPGWIAKHNSLPPEQTQLNP